MIKIYGKSNKYDYGEVGKQQYDINTTITFDDEATLDQVVEGVMRMAQLVGYSTIGMPTILRNIADDLENDLRYDAKWIKNKYGEEE